MKSFKTIMLYTKPPNFTFWSVLITSTDIYRILQMRVSRSLSWWACREHWLIHESDWNLLSLVQWTSGWGLPRSPLFTRTLVTSWHFNSWEFGCNCWKLNPMNLPECFFTITGWAESQIPQDDLGLFNDLLGQPMGTTWLGKSQLTFLKFMKAI